MFDAATKKCASYRMGKGSSGRCNDLEGAGCDKCGETTKQREKREGMKVIGVRTV